MTDNLSITTELKGNAPTLKTISMNILRLRKQMNLTQGDVAKLLDKSRLYVIELEKGDKDIPVSVLYDLSEIFGCKITDLIPVEKLDEAPVELRGDEVSKDSQKQIAELLKAAKTAEE